MCFVYMHMHTIANLLSNKNKCKIKMNLIFFESLFQLTSIYLYAHKQAKILQKTHR